MLQVESYSMDAILQIFKQSIDLSTPFFQSLAKKPPATMDDLFRQADKYFMLKDDVQVATQQVLVTNHPTKDNEARSFKPSNQSRQASKRRASHQQQNQVRLTPFNISYERLLLMICGLSNFRWSKSIKIDPTRQDRNKRCSFHKDHGHTIEQCKSLHYLVQKLIRVGHLKQYVCIVGKQRETAQEVAIQASTFLAAPRVVIIYIHGSPINDRYSSKQKKQGLLCAVSIRVWVNSVQCNFSKGMCTPLTAQLPFLQQVLIEYCNCMKMPQSLHQGQMDSM